MRDGTLINKILFILFVIVFKLIFKNLLFLSSFIKSPYYFTETSIFFVILPEGEKEEHNLSLLRGNTKGSNEIIEDSRRMANMTEKFSKDLARSFLEALLVQRYCYKKKKITLFIVNLIYLFNVEQSLRLF